MSRHQHHVHPLPLCMVPIISFAVRTVKWDPGLEGAIRQLFRSSWTGRADHDHPRLDSAPADVSLDACAVRHVRIWPAYPSCPLSGTAGSGQVNRPLRPRIFESLPLQFSSRSDARGGRRKWQSGSSRRSSNGRCSALGRARSASASPDARQDVLARAIIARGAGALPS
jgi:hypothetical protein